METISNFLMMLRVSGFKQDNQRSVQTYNSQQNAIITKPVFNLISMSLKVSA